MNTDQSGAGDKPVRPKNRRVIEVSCSTHGGCRNFTPLVCTKVEGLIELDPHAMGCVIVLDEKAATALCDLLGEWLG